jgi:hypothetical protein
MNVAQYENRIAFLNGHIEELSEVRDEARWIFAQIAQIHSTDHGDPLDRCMELGRKGYKLTRTASADTHPKDGDAVAAPLVSGAVPTGQTPDPSHATPSPEAGE